MSRPESPFSPDEIYAYWSAQAASFGQSSDASWSDRWMIDLEIRTLRAFLNDRERVLDVGCANGYSTVQFAQHAEVEVLGIDYVDAMIAEARRRVETLPVAVRDRVRFETGDARSMTDIESRSFDCVIATRVLINLGSNRRQADALGECARVLRSGGLLLLSEATLQGWRRLNSIRVECDLEEIPMPPMNRYLDEEEVIEVLRQHFDLEQLLAFSSSYYLCTRVLKPLLARIGAVAIDPSDPSSEFNRLSSLLPAIGDYGTQKLFVCRKR